MRHHLSRVHRRATRGAAQRGSALVTALAFSVITLTVGASILAAGSSESRNAQQRLNSQKAFWLAEAGYQRLAAESYTDATWLTSHRSFGDTLSGGIYSVSVRDTTVSGLAAGVTPYHVISTGTIAGLNAASSRVIDLMITVGSTSSSLNLGTASPGTYAMLAIGNTNVAMTGSSVIQGTVANIGVLDGDVSMTGSSEINGTVFVSSANTASVTGSSTVGAVVQNASTDAQLTQASLDAIAASSTYGAMAATNSTKTITGAKTLTGVSGVNVVNLTSFNVTGSKTVTLAGPADAYWIINDSGVFSLDGSSQIMLSGGITADHVLINLTGNGNLTVNSSSVINGIVLAPYRTTSIGGSSTINGALLAGGDPTSGTTQTLSFTGSSTINGVGSSTTSGTGALAMAHWSNPR